MDSRLDPSRLAVDDDGSEGLDRELDEQEVAQSVAWLGSPAAFASLEADSYWPKWDSPWWHMRLLVERGEAARIPPAIVDAMARAIDRMPLKIFPIKPGDVPAGLDASRDSSCHCALGTIVPLLMTCGVDIDRALPWARDWFRRYQMADGGYNCDGDAYLVTGEVPSSMVATIAPLEALLALTAQSAQPEDLVVLDRAAAFMVGRALTRGSETIQNAEERTSALAWPELTFPRFYFYDVLRGLSAVVTWAERREQHVRWSSISEVVVSLLDRFPDGQVRIGRRAFGGALTRLRSQDGDGAWTRGHPQSTFPLLDASSRLGETSPFLTRQWRETRKGLLTLAKSGLLLDH